MFHVNKTFLIWACPSFSCFPDYNHKSMKNKVGLYATSLPTELLVDFPLLSLTQKKRIQQGVKSTISIEKKRILSSVNLRDFVLWWQKK
jgi:hypothetical protein